MSYSSAQLQGIAKRDIKELIHIIDHSGSDINTLEIAIEILSDESDSEECVLPILNRFLKHVHVLVREASMVGVTTFYAGKSPPKEILSRLEVISNNDPSSYLRDFAKDILNEFRS